MACLLNTGYDLGCRDSLGGIKRAYIANFDSLQSYTLDADNNITALDITSPPQTYYTFEQEMENGEFNQIGNYSTENGTVYFTQILTLILHKNDAALRNQLLVLSQANLSIIVQDQRDEYWLLGKENGIRVSAGSQNTGKAFGDMNGVSITFEGKEAEPASRIEGFASIIDVA